MEFDMENPLWKTDPEKAKRYFEKELLDMKKNHSPLLEVSVHTIIDDILGKKLRRNG